MSGVLEFVFRVMTLRSFVHGYRRFRRICCLYSLGCDGMLYRRWLPVFRRNL